MINKRGLHLLLLRKLTFPSFYGMNWDAFRDVSLAWSGSQNMCASLAGISSRLAFPAGPPCFGRRSTTTKPRTARSSSLSTPSDEQSLCLGMTYPMPQIHLRDPRGSVRLAVTCGRRLPSPAPPRTAQRRPSRGTRKGGPPVHREGKQPSRIGRLLTCNAPPLGLPALFDQFVRRAAR
ncbi:barstar family protein [Streptomyces niveus]|uniref:barstar family protein n=1 Tax=Streptomyces niveus TaxID=193462 RepID=UPI00343B1E9B